MFISFLNLFLIHFYFSLKKSAIKRHDLNNTSNNSFEMSTKKRFNQSINLFSAYKTPKSESTPIVPKGQTPKILAITPVSQPPNPMVSSLFNESGVQNYCIEGSEDQT